MRERWCHGSRKWKMRGSDWIIKKKWVTRILRLFKIYFNKVDGMFSLRLNGVVRGYILRS